jgi:hypothetical protein
MNFIDIEFANSKSAVSEATYVRHGDSGKSKQARRTVKRAESRGVRKYINEYLMGTA